MLMRRPMMVMLKVNGSKVGVHNGRNSHRTARNPANVSVRSHSRRCSVIPCLAAPQLVFGGVSVCIRQYLGLRSAVSWSVLSSVLVCVRQYLGQCLVVSRYLFGSASVCVR